METPMQIHRCAMHIHTWVKLHLGPNANRGPCVSPVLLLRPALSMQILLVQNCATEIPSPGPKVPKAVPLAVQSLAFGEQHQPAQTAIPHCASAHASLLQPLGPALALTGRGGCLTPLALPVMRRSSPVGANPAREPSPANTALRAMWLPGAIPSLNGVTASQCHGAGRAGADRAGCEGGRGTIQQGIDSPEVLEQPRKAEAAWPHFHSLALPDTISSRLCLHRDTRAVTGAHGQQDLALLRVINHVLFDPSLSRAAERVVHIGGCVVLSQLFNFARVGSRRHRAWRHSPKGPVTTMMDNHCTVWGLLPG